MVTPVEIRQGKILIVDNLAANVRLLERTLTGAGYSSVTSTMNPFEVCDLHRKNKYDAILLDLKMPGMDGFEIIQGLKEIEVDSYLPVLVITAMHEHKLRALQAGARDFISMPIDLVEVHARVYNMLEVRLLHAEASNYAKSLECLALRDPLTLLPNRRLLLERTLLAIADARRNNGSMAMMFLDLDGFKQINDRWGHGAGDALLQMAAGRLVAAVRQQDTVARLGGDEFVITLWPNISAADAAKLGMKLIATISESYNIQGHMMGVTVSAGVGMYPMHGEDMDTLLESADVALYEAKHAGKNQYRVSERSSP